MISSSLVESIELLRILGLWRKGLFIPDKSILFIVLLLSFRLLLLVKIGPIWLMLLIWLNNWGFKFEEFNILLISILFGILVWEILNGGNTIPKPFWIILLLDNADNKLLFRIFFSILLAKVSCSFSFFWACKLSIWLLLLLFWILVLFNKVLLLLLVFIFKLEYKWSVLSKFFSFPLFEFWGAPFILKLLSSISFWIDFKIFNKLFLLESSLLFIPSI